MVRNTGKTTVVVIAAVRASPRKKDVSQKTAHLVSSAVAASSSADVGDEVSGVGYEREHVPQQREHLYDDEENDESSSSGQIAVVVCAEECCDDGGEVGESRDNSGFGEHFFGLVPGPGEKERTAYRDDVSDRVADGEGFRVAFDQLDHSKEAAEFDEDAESEAHGESDESLPVAQLGTTFAALVFESGLLRGRIDAQKRSRRRVQVLQRSTFGRCPHFFTTCVRDTSSGTQS